MKVDIYPMTNECNHILCTEPIKFLILRDGKLFAMVCPEHLEVWETQAKQRSQKLWKLVYALCVGKVRSGVTM